MGRSAGILGYFLVVCLAVILAGCAQVESDPTWRVVVVVPDGDDLLLDGGETIRLLGLNTPSPDHWYGREAWEFTRHMAQGKRVRLEYDLRRRDDSGRTLAYVYLEDGTFLNVEIIRQGYGHVYTKWPCRYASEFRQYEQEAQGAGRGLWRVE